LVRHLKHCSRGTNAPPRQKSCRQCVTAKGRCDLRRPNCGRCRTRSLECEFQKGDDKFPTNQPNLLGQLRDENESLNTDECSNTHSLVILQEGSAVAATSILDPNTYKARLRTLSSNWDNIPDGIAPELVISKQRRQAILGTPTVDTSSNILTRQITFFVIRVLRSWPRMMAENHSFQLPPMMHHLQFTNGLPVPLANCYTLVKMCLSYEEGSRELVNDTIVQEVKRLLREVCLNFSCISRAENLYSIVLTPS
jgi:hypothetical protein